MASEDLTQLDETWQFAAMEPELTEREKALRDLFVNEFLVDYDEIKAAQRVGFQKAFAEDYAKKFMAESYVQKRIKQLEHSIKADDKSMEEYDRQTVLAVLRKEAQNPFGTPAARVQAAAKLASIRGMDKPIEIKAETTHKGGVMMVPAIADLNDWEKMALDSQAKLVSDARH